MYAFSLSPVRLALLISWVLLLPAPAGSLAQRADRQPQPQGAAAASEPQLPQVLELEDAVELLAPEEPRTEDERNRLDALAMFSAARMLELQEDYAAALRLYQRALRCDLEGAAIVRAIVPLAVRLGRNDQANRYAIKAAELEDADPELLRRLSSHLIQTGDWQRALALYEKAEASGGDDEPTAGDVLLQMQMGRLYHLADEHEKAADCFTEVLEAIEQPERFGLNAAQKKALLGERQAAYALIGEALILADRPERAAAVFQKSHEADPNEGLLNYNLARVDLAMGKPEAALSKLQAYFDEEAAGQGLAPYQLLREILDKLDREDELLARLEELHAGDPENVPLAYFLAGEYHRQEQFDDAEPLYVELAEKAPTIVAYGSLIDIYRKTERPDAMLRVLGEAAEKNAALELIEAEDRALSDDTELVAALVATARDRLEADPDQFGYGPRLAAAQLALAAGQNDAAGEFFDLAIEAKPDQAAKLLLVWGLGLLDRDEYEPAAAVFQRGVDGETPADKVPMFYYYLAVSLEMAGHTDRSLAAAGKAIELKDDTPLFFSRKAWIFYHSDRYKEAGKAYGELIERFDSEYGSSLVRRVLRESRLALSHLCVLQEDLSQAEEWLEQVLDEFPDDTSAMNDLGYLWADADKNIHRAHRMVRRAVEAEPDNAAYLDSLGWVLFRMGRLEEAVAELEKAAALQTDPVIFEHLGDSYHQSGRPDKAKEAWGRSVEAFQEAEDADGAKRVRKKIDHQP